VSRELRWSRRAQQDLARLDRRVADRVIEAVVRYVDAGAGDVKRLTGGDELRLRVGDWRVRFVVRIDVRPAAAPGAEPVLIQVVEILRVLPRGRAYRD
jgi:mRNA-degrading endonuclease RelE of RelBE toxin-antitoxin system